jgi:hypothetical protein
MNWSNMEPSSSALLRPPTPAGVAQPGNGQGHFRGFPPSQLGFQLHQRGQGQENPKTAIIPPNYLVNIFVTPFSLYTCL